MQWNNVIRISCIYDRSCALSAVKFQIIFTWCFSYYVNHVIIVCTYTSRVLGECTLSLHRDIQHRDLLVYCHVIILITDRERISWSTWSTVCKSRYVVFAVHCNVNPNVKTFRKCKLPQSWIFLYKPWRPKGFIQFEIIINVLVGSFWFILILMLWVYGHYKYIYSFSAGIVFIRQNLTPADLRFWRIDGPRTD